MAEEKKDGFLNKFKKKFNSVVLENSLEIAFNKANDSFYLYTGNDLFDGKLMHGKLDLENNTLLVYGIVDAPYGSMIVDEKKDHYFYVTKVDHDESINVTVKTVEDGKENIYTRQGTLFTLDSDVKEVKVIKVEDKYFLRLPEEKAN